MAAIKAVFAQDQGLAKKNIRSTLREAAANQQRELYVDKWTYVLKIVQI
jgi:hypothetical protein